MYFGISEILPPLEPCNIDGPALQGNNTHLLPLWGNKLNLYQFSEESALKALQGVTLKGKTPISFRENRTWSLF